MGEGKLNTEHPNLPARSHPYPRPPSPGPAHQPRRPPPPSLVRQAQAPSLPAPFKVQSDPIPEPNFTPRGRKLGFTLRGRMKKGSTFPSPPEAPLVPRTGAPATSAPGDLQAGSGSARRPRAAAGVLGRAARCGGSVSGRSAGAARPLGKAGGPCGREEGPEGPGPPPVRRRLLPAVAPRAGMGPAPLGLAAVTPTPRPGPLPSGTACPGRQDGRPSVKREIT